MEKNSFEFRVYPYYHGNDEASKSTPFVDEMELNKDGKVVVTGQRNVDELIQSFEAECDINNIILRHIELGTLAELGLGEFTDKVVDVSNIPQDLNTMNQQVSDARKIYTNLNDQQKALFKDYDDFVLNFDKLFKKQESEVANNE